MKGKKRHLRNELAAVQAHDIFEKCDEIATALYSREAICAIIAGRQRGMAAKIITAGSLSRASKQTAEPAVELIGNAAEYDQRSDPADWLNLR